MLILNVAWDAAFAGDAHQYHRRPCRHPFGFCQTRTGCFFGPRDAMQQSYEGSADSVVIVRSIATASVLALEYLSVAGR